MDPVRDLGSIANLVAAAFADEIDARGQAALREMRWMARLSPLVWWWAQADPSFQDTFNGFVWEEPSPRGTRQIIGNVSLNRAPGNRRRSIICNVAVRDEYQGQGIGRQLMEAAIAEAQGLGVEGVILQVYQDNPRARRLYTHLDFEQVAGETDLRLESVQPVTFLDAPTYHFRSWKPADGQAVYDLACHTIPLAQQWMRPLRSEEYRPDWPIRVAQSIADWIAGRKVYRLVVLQEERLVAMMAVTVALRRGEHRLALLVHPNYTGQVEAVLVSRAFHLLATAPPRPARITVDMEAEATLKVLRDYGFTEQRTLLTLRRDLE